MNTICKSVLISLALGSALCGLQYWAKTTYLHDFLRGNLTVIQLTLLAINGATLGLIIPKLRELQDRSNNGANFSNSRSQMELSIHEQVVLTVTGFILLMIEKSPRFESEIMFRQFISILLPACLVYSFLILVDTSKAVFIVFNREQPSS